MASSEIRTTGNVPNQPLESLAPPPRVLWSGDIQGILGRSPARVVLRYVWTLPAGAKEWEARAEYLLEVAKRSDAMRVPIWETDQLTNLPAEFFEDYMRATAAIAT